MLPEAFISHRTADRLRIRIPSRKRDAGYFKEIGDRLVTEGGIRHIELNPLSGSMLIRGDGIDVHRLTELAREGNLFRLRRDREESGTVAHKVCRPLTGINRTVKDVTGGELDIPTMFFLGLLCVGIVQLVRGNLRAPPWYTAFWYAFGVFTKSLLDSGNKKSPEGS